MGRRNLQCVEALQENPLNFRQVLVGYGRGLIVLWDLDARRAVQQFLGTQVCGCIAALSPLCFLVCPSFSFYTSYSFVASTGEDLYKSRKRRVVVKSCGYVGVLVHPRGLMRDTVSQQLESMWWVPDGGCVLSCHSDGSYCQWKLGEEKIQLAPHRTETPYGESLVYF